MAAGGRRPGAGRPKGAANKLNDAARAQALEGGISPLDYLLGVLRDGDLDRETRMDAAKAAAPYVHARLSSIEAKHDVSDALSDLMKEVDGRTRGIPTGG